MLKYSLSSVYMTILTSNLLLILIALFFHNRKVMINLGYRLLAIFVCISLLRSLFPFEFSFTRTIFLPECISPVIVIFRYPFFYIGSFDVTIWKLCELIWLIGIGIYFTRFLKEIRIFHSQVLLFGRLPAKHKYYMTVLEDICRKHGKKNKFRIRELNSIESPQIYGIRKPCILLPADLDFSDEDMYYVLSHEANHHFHHDLLLKCVVRILTIVYWWNPACHYLYRKASLLLEMRIDNTVVDTREETSKYLNCLISLAEKARTSNQLNRTGSLALSFSQSTRHELTQRFEMLIYRRTSPNLLLSVFVFAAIFIIYLLSYFYTFEAFYTTPEVAETISITEDTSYFIQNEDGTYDLYHGDVYFETVSSLEYYLDDIPIYTREEYDKLILK